MKLKLLFLAFAICWLDTAVGQDAVENKDARQYGLLDTLPLTDTLKPLKDSLLFYRNIYEYANKRKVTKMIYKLIFSDKALRPSSKPIYTPLAATVPVALPTENFDLYSGKIIRTIHIVALDPFGYSVNDTIIRDNDFLKRTSNHLHIKSRRITIKNQLLIKKNKPLDPLALRESERIIRSANYIRDAKITVVPLANSDSVDVSVIVQDRWSITLSGTVSGSSTRINIGEKNFGGLGHQFRNNITVKYSDPLKPKIDGTYSTPYFGNTFITATAYYSTNEINRLRGLVLDRGFYSPLAKWAGGTGIIRYNTISVYTADSVPTAFPLEYEQKDIWIGRSFQLVPGRSVIKRTTRLIITGSYIDKHFLRRPSFEFDTNRDNQHVKLALGSIGIANQQYYKDRYIYRFGEAEDVPTGRVLVLTGGQEQKEFSMRYYSSLRASGGDHIQNVGFLSFNAEYGTFFRKNKFEDGVLTLGLNYLTDRWNIRKWGGRQFIYYQFTRGFNRSVGDKITINDNYGIYGFKSKVLAGDRKMYLNFVSVIYIPHKLIGFRFAAILFSGFGIIGNTTNSLVTNKVHQGYGLGFLIRNDQLLVKSFQVSFGIYPFMPDPSEANFRMDIISTSDLRFRGYGISRPGIISFQ